MAPSFPLYPDPSFSNASRNKFSESSYSNKNSGADSDEISEFMANGRFAHDQNDELALLEYSSGNNIKKKKKKIRGSYRGSTRMHMYRRMGSEETSNIRLENRNRMARRETRNPISEFLKMILVKFGCSEN